MGWRGSSVKQAFLICDAPGHGRDINGLINTMFKDDYPYGSPDGHKIQEQLKIFASKNINFTIVKMNDRCDAMIKVMKDNYNSAQR